MSNEALFASLTANGIRCSMETGFGFFYDLTGENKRVVCFEKVVPVSGNQALNAGISFWLHAGSGLLFLGIWTGIFFRVGHPPRVKSLVVDLLSGQHLRKGNAPYGIPSTVMVDYSLHKCDLIRVLPNNPCERLEEATKETALARVTSTHSIDDLCKRVDSCRHKSNGLLELRLGEASAIARLHASDQEVAQNNIPLLICPKVNSSSDCVRLLSELSDILDCALFDTGWGNRIHLDDPYYAGSTFDNRPEEPTNAWADD